jgi:hypothetical protein
MEATSMGEFKNAPESELPSAREPAVYLEEGDHSYDHCVLQLVERTDIRWHLEVLRDKPTVSPKGKRHERWLYFKAWKDGALRGCFVYDNGPGKEPDLSW